MQTNPVVSALVFGLRFVPVVRNWSWVASHGSLDGALLLFAKAEKAITDFAVMAEAEADRIADKVKALDEQKVSLESQKSAKLDEAVRANRVAARVTDLLK